jgi:hypothetical protein
MVSKSRKTANRLFQREHKERMYSAGFKQRVVWIKRDDDDAATTTDMKSFLSAFRQMVKVIPKEKRSRLFRDILSITEYTAWQGETYGK